MADRVTQVGLQSITLPTSGSERITQVALTSLTLGAPAGRMTQIAFSAIAFPNSTAILTQAALVVLRENTPDAAPFTSLAFMDT